MTGKKRIIGSSTRAVASNTARLMQENRMTYRELSQRLRGLGQPIPVIGIRRMISGDRLISIDEAEALAEVFGLSLSEMIDPTADYRTHVLRWLLAESEFLAGQS